jgi:transposase
MLTALLATDPQTHGHRATGWTVPLLRTELAARGTVVGERTIRRALDRLGYRWKRPRYILGRPDIVAVPRSVPLAARNCHY